MTVILNALNISPTHNFLRWPHIHFWLPSFAKFHAFNPNLQNSYTYLPHYVAKFSYLNIYMYPAVFLCLSFVYLQYHYMYLPSSSFFFAKKQKTFASLTCSCICPISEWMSLFGTYHAHLDGFSLCQVHQQQQQLQAFGVVARGEVSPPQNPLCHQLVYYFA